MSDPILKEGTDVKTLGQELFEIAHDLYEEQRYLHSLAADFDEVLRKHFTLKCVEK